MATYTVRAPDGKLLTLQGPPGASEAEVIAQAQRLYQPTTQTQPPAEGSIFDIPLQAAQGATYGVRALTDIFGAENIASRGLRGVEGYLGGLLSAQAKNDQAEISRIFQEAEDKGFGAQLSAAWEAVKTAPVSALAQAAGTALPTIAGGLAGAGIRGGAIAIPALIGAGMGTGIIKGSIYDTVQQQLLAAGATEEQASKAASQAQAYTGDNLDMILTGGFLGALTGGTGIEPAIARAASGSIIRSLIGRTAVGAAKEAIPEALQAGQEQLAQNLALQREGFDVPALRGVAGSAAYEGLISAGLGAGVGAVEPMLARGERKVDPGGKEEAPGGKEEAQAGAVEDEQVLSALPVSVRNAVRTISTLENIPVAEALQVYQDSIRTGAPPVATQAPVAPPVTGVTEAPVAPPVTEIPPVTGVPEVTGVTKAPVAPPVTGVPEVTELPPARQRTYFPEETKEQRQERIWQDEDRRKDLEDLGALVETPPTVAPTAPIAASTVAPAAPVKAAPSIETELRSYIKKLGGIKIKDAEGNITSEGSNILAAIKDSGDKKLINNKNGVTPDYLRESLAEAGWFGPRADAQGEIGNLYDLLAKSTQEGAVYHPESKKAQKQAEVGYKGPTTAEVDAELNDALRAMPNEPKFKKGEREAARILYAQYGNDAESAVAGIIERRAVQTEAKTAPKTREEVSIPGFETTPVSTAENVKVTYDNPGGDWLKGKQKLAQDSLRKGRKISGPVTAFSEVVDIAPSDLAKIPGSMDENPVPGSPKYDALFESISKEGFNRAKSGPILVGVNYRGDPYIIEGNNRVAVARDLNVPSVPVEFRWFSGGETAARGFKPKNINALVQITKEKTAPTPAAPTEAPTRTAENILADANAALKNKGITAKGLTRIKTLAAKKAPVQDIQAALDEELDNTAGSSVRQKKAPNATGRLLGEVQAVVDNLTKNWKSDLKVVVVQNVAQLPESVRGKVERAGAEGLSGVAITDGNTAYLIADNLGSDSDVAAVLYHEALGHAGLARLFGTKLDGTLKAIYNTNPDLKSEADTWLQNNPNEYAGEANRELRGLEEVLAGRAERGQIKPKVLARLTSILRDFGRRVGINLSYNNTDVASILYRASKRITEGGRNAAEKAKDLRFSKKPPQDKITSEATETYKTTSPEEDPETVADAIGAATVAHDIEPYEQSLERSIAMFGPKKLRALLEGTPIATITDDWFSKAMPGLKTAVGFTKQFNARKNNILRTYQPLRNALNTHRRKYGGQVLGDLAVTAREKNVNVTDNPTLAEGIANDEVLNFLNPKLAAARKNKKAPAIAKYEALIGDRTEEIKEVYALWDELGKQGNGRRLYNELKAFYRAMYVLERKAWRGNLDAYKGIIPDADIQKLKDAADEAEAAAEAPDPDYYDGAPQPKLIENYVPFMRLGEFALRIPQGKVPELPKGYYEQFDSDAERTERVIELTGKYKLDPSVFIKSLRPENDILPLISDNTSLRGLYDIVDAVRVEDTAVSFLKAGTSNKTSEQVVNELRKDLKEQLNSILLSRLPQRSIGKRKLKARNVPGMSRDMFRVFDVSLSQYATQIPKMELAPKARLALSAQRDAITPDVPSDIAEKLNIVIDSVAKRVETAFNPPAKNKFVTALKEFTYLMLLSSPATAMVQTSTIPIRALPKLGSEYGYGKASSVLSANSKIFMQLGERRQDGFGGSSYTFKELDSLNKVKNNKLLLRAFNDLRRRGAFYETLRGAISGFQGKAGDSLVARGYDLFYNVGSALFNTSETLTRQIVAMSAFELEYEKTKNYESAITKAVETAENIAGDYSEIARLPVMSGSVGEFVFQFKQYAVITTRFFWTNAYKMLVSSGVSPKERIQAMNELAGVLIMGGMFHGLLGMPLFTLITSTIDVLRGMLEDEDDEDARARYALDPYSAGSSARWFQEQWLPTHFGDIKIPSVSGEVSLADVLERGPVSALTDANIGSRTTFDQLWFRSPRTAENWQDWFKNLVFANLGPSVSLGEGAFAALDDFNEGKFLRGLSKMLPALGRGPVNAYRLATEGEKVGEDVAISPSEISIPEIIGQALGIRPTRVVQIMDKVYAVKGAEIRIRNERSSILRDLNRAMTGASGASSLDEAYRRAAQFNARYPQLYFQIEGEDIFDSLNTYINNRENTARGVRVTPENYRYILQRFQ